MRQKRRPGHQSALKKSIGNRLHFAGWPVLTNLVSPPKSASFLLGGANSGGTMKHTIKTQMGRSLVLELAGSKAFAWIELLSSDNQRSYCELLEVEQLQSLVIAAEAMIDRIRAVQEGNKRNKKTACGQVSNGIACQMQRDGTEKICPDCNPWRPMEKAQGLRCHDANACAAGQAPCPSKAACGVVIV